MRKVWVMTALAGALFSQGCAKTEPPKQQKGIEIHAPGVDIKIDGDGVDVNAPGTKVRADRDKGVEVQAPGVEVEARPRKPVPDPTP